MSPAYVAPPFNRKTSLPPGQTGYAFGSFNDQEPPTEATVTNVAIASNVATLTVTLRKGDAPKAGSLLSTQGIPNNSGAFNVSNVAISSVSFTGATGTIVFPLTHADVSSAAASGLAVVPQPIVGDAIASGNKSQAFALIPSPGGNKQYGLSWFTKYGGTAVPTGVSISLQIADIDEDDEYTTVDTSTAVAGETRSIGNITANFVRLIATTITGGTSPTLAAGIIVR